MYVYVRMNICMYDSKCVCMFVVCMYVFIYVCMYKSMYSCMYVCTYPWYSVGALDYWPTGRAIDSAPGACFIMKFISFVQVVQGPVQPYSAVSWPKTPIISMYACNYVLMNLCILICMNVYMYACMYVVTTRVCIYVWKCVLCFYLWTHSFIYIQSKNLIDHHYILLPSFPFLLQMSPFVFQ